MPHGSMLHIPPTNLLLLAAKQEPYREKKKSLSLNEKYWKNFLENNQQAKKKKRRRYDRKRNRLHADGRRRCVSLICEQQITTVFNVQIITAPIRTCCNTNHVVVGFSPQGSRNSSQRSDRRHFEYFFSFSS